MLELTSFWLFVIDSNVGIPLSLLTLSIELRVVTYSSKSRLRTRCSGPVCNFSYFSSQLINDELPHKTENIGIWIFRTIWNWRYRGRQMGSFKIDVPSLSPLVTNLSDPPPPHPVTSTTAHKVCFASAASLYLDDVAAVTAVTCMMPRQKCLRAENILGENRKTKINLRDLKSRTQF